MIIKFQILKSVVVDAVKSATYLKGKMDSSLQNGAEKASYQETAGEDEVHIRTLTHDFDTALEILKTIFVDYLVPTPRTIGDNVIYYDKVDDSVVQFTLDVSRRYNGTLTDALARLSAKYVEDYMMYQWWLKTTNLKQAEPYQATLASDEVAIRKCFVLCGPTVPPLPYTDTLTVKIDGADSDGNVTLKEGNDTTLTFTIDDGALDDIEVYSGNPRILETHRGAVKSTFILHPLREGETSVTVYSRHNERSVTSKVTIKER